MLLDINTKQEYNLLIIFIKNIEFYFLIKNILTVNNIYVIICNIIYKLSNRKDVMIQ